MGAQARRTVCERFTRERMVAAWLDALWPGERDPASVSDSLRAGRPGG